LAGKLAPAIHRDLAVLGVQTHDDIARKRGARVLQETGVLHGSGADDDVLQTGIQILFNRVQIANATAQLHGDFAIHFTQDRLDGRQVLGLASKCTVQIHQMQATCTGIEPAACHFGGITEGSGLVHVTLFEADALAVFEVDGGDQQHDGLRALPSGWPKWFASGQG